MSNFLADLPPTKPLAPGRYGALPNTPGVRATRLDLALATLSAGRDAGLALSAAVEAACGAALPQGPHFAQGDNIGFVGIGPGRWTVVAQTDGEALVAKLEAIAGALGSVCDQSDGSVVFGLSGAKVREALVKMLNIDIDPAAFGKGSAATTHAALIGVTLWQPGDAPVYRVAVARSYALAFLRALAASAAEYGFELA